MNNLFFLAAETTKTTKTFWEVFVNTDELVGLIINIILLGLLGYVVFIFFSKFTKYQEIINKSTYSNAMTNAKSVSSIVGGEWSSPSNPYESLFAKFKEVKNDDIDKSSATEQLITHSHSELSRLEEKVGILATCSGVAPMIGFLGTTIGMVEVFMALEASKSLEISMISGGILTAMTTTVSGLVVGIVAYLAYNHLVLKLEKIAINMEQINTTLLKSYSKT